MPGSKYQASGDVGLLELSVAMTNTSNITTPLGWDVLAHLILIWFIISFDTRLQWENRYSSAFLDHRGYHAV